MTAENACLELLSFSKCHRIPIHWAFLAGFWLLACTATATTATFFIGHHYQSISRRLSWVAIVLGLITIVLFQGLAVSAWIVVEVVSSMLEDGTRDSNGRSIYLTFTCIAFVSVAICIIVRRHRSGGNCDKCDRGPVNYSSRPSPSSSSDREKSLGDTDLPRDGSDTTTISQHTPTIHGTHPALRPRNDQHIPIVCQVTHERERSVN
jgi:hypothetical protein